MPRHRHPARIAAGHRTFIALALGMGLAAAFPVAVVAECDPVVGTWPIFSETARVAPTIVTGEVVALLDTSRAAISIGAPPMQSKFSLRVDRVVRGSSAPLLSFRTPLEPPGSQCLGTVQAGLGDRLALALGEASDGDQPSFLAVAYIYRVHADQYPIPDGMAITDAEVARLAQLPVSRLPVLVFGGLIASAALLAIHARPGLRRSRGRDDASQV